MARAHKVGATRASPGAAAIPAAQRASSSSSRGSSADGISAGSNSSSAECTAGISASPVSATKHSPIDLDDGAAAAAAAAAAPAITGIASDTDASAMWDKPAVVPSPQTIASPVRTRSATSPAASPSRARRAVRHKPTIVYSGVSIACESVPSSSAGLGSSLSASTTGTAPSLVSDYYQSYRRVTASALTGTATGTSALAALGHGHRYASAALGAGKTAAAGVLQRIRSGSVSASAAEPHTADEATPCRDPEAGASADVVEFVAVARASGAPPAHGAARVRWSSFDRLPSLMIEQPALGTIGDPARRAGKQQALRSEPGAPLLFVCSDEPAGMLQAWTPSTGLHAGEAQMDEVLRFSPEALLDCAEGLASSVQPLAARVVVRSGVQARQRAGDRAQAALHLVLAVLLSGAEDQAVEVWEIGVADASLVRRATLLQVPPEGAAAAHARIHITDKHLIVALSVVSSPTTHSEGTTASGSIHIHDALTLERIFDPILDTAPAFVDRPPAIDASQRILAYASTSTFLQSADAPPRATAVAARPSASHKARSGSSPLSPPKATTAANDASSAHPLLSRARRVGGSIGSSAWAFGATGADFVAQRMAHLSTDGSGRDKEDGEAANAAEVAEAAAAAASVVEPSFRPKRTIVRIVDLGSSLDGAPRPLAAFPHAARAGPIACLRFDHRGDMLFSADTAGQTFVVHGIRFGSRLNAGLGTAVRPIYRIHRGVTTAEISDAEWSRDSQLLHVQSKRGTTHTVTIARDGLRPEPAAIVKARSGGSQPAIVVDLPAEATTLPVTAHTWPAEGRDVAAAAGKSIPASDWPAFIVVDDAHLGDTRSWRTLSFDGASGAVSDVGKALTARRVPLSTNAASRASALTHLIKGGKGSWPADARSAASLHADTLVESKGKAATRVWPCICQPVPQAETVLGLSAPYVPNAPPNKTPSVAAAEIETYTKRSRHRLPHVLISHQFNYASFPNDTSKAMQHPCDAHRIPTTRLDVRTVVQVKAPTETTFSRNSPCSFDEGLGQAFLNPRWQSPDAVIPSFPQGATGRTPGWSQRALPIRTVTSGMQNLRSTFGRTARQLSRSHERRRDKGLALSFDEAESDERTFLEAASLGSSQSPGLAATGISPETPVTSLDSDDDTEELELAWQLARGTGEDVEGDEQGYDGFADEEWGGKGLVRLNPHFPPKSDHSSGETADEFLVGVFDEEAEGAASRFVEPKAATPTPLSTSLPASLTPASAALKVEPAKKPTTADSSRSGKKKAGKR